MASAATASSFWLTRGLALRCIIIGLPRLSGLLSPHSMTVV